MGKPISWKRCRRSGNRYFDSQVADKKRYVEVISFCGKDVCLHSEPIKVTTEYYMQIPNSWSLKRKAAALWNCHPSRPDLDNLNKFVYDALQGVLWTDDALIVESFSFKRYAEYAKTVITIEKIEKRFLLP